MAASNMNLTRLDCTRIAIDTQFKQSFFANKQCSGKMVLGLLSTFSI